MFKALHVGARSAHKPTTQPVGSAAACGRSGSESASLPPDSGAARGRRRSELAACLAMVCVARCAAVPSAAGSAASEVEWDTGPAATREGASGTSEAGAEAISVAAARAVVVGADEIGSACLRACSRCATRCSELSSGCRRFLPGPGPPGRGVQIPSRDTHLHTLLCDKGLISPACGTPALGGEPSRGRLGHINECPRRFTRRGTGVAALRQKYRCSRMALAAESGRRAAG
jgi:hypothetical protein